MPFKAKVLLFTVGLLIACALIAMWAKAARAAPADAPPAGSQPDAVDDPDPTPPDQLTPEQLAAGTSGKVTYGRAIGWDGKRLRRYRSGQVQAPLSVVLALLVRDPQPIAGVSPHPSRSSEHATIGSGVRTLGGMMGWLAT
jgi:hypothetical protein